MFSTGQANQLPLVCIKKTLSYLSFCHFLCPASRLDKQAFILSTSPVVLANIHYSAEDSYSHVHTNNSRFERPAYHKEKTSHPTVSSDVFLHNDSFQMPPFWEQQAAFKLYSLQKRFVQEKGPLEKRIIHTGSTPEKLATAIFTPGCMLFRTDTKYSKVVGLLN